MYYQFLNFILYLQREWHEKNQFDNSEIKSLIHHTADFNQIERNIEIN